MARLQKTCKVGRMSRMLKEFSIEHSAGLKMADMAALLVQSVPRERLLETLANSSQEPPRSEPAALLPESVPVPLPGLVPMHEEMRTGPVQRKKSIARAEPVKILQFFPHPEGTYVQNEHGFYVKEEVSPADAQKYKKVIAKKANVNGWVTIQFEGDVFWQCLSAAEVAELVSNPSWVDKRVTNGKKTGTVASEGDNMYGVGDDVIKVMWDCGRKTVSVKRNTVQLVDTSARKVAKAKAPEDTPLLGLAVSQKVKKRWVAVRQPAPTPSTAVPLESNAASAADADEAMQKGQADKVAAKRKAGGNAKGKAGARSNAKGKMMAGALCGMEQRKASMQRPNNTQRQKVLLLQLKRPHYNAIKDGRKKWEARPLLRAPDKYDICRQSVADKLAQVGRAVVLQSGFGTNDRVQIEEVRRFSLEEMVRDLGADLLPDATDGKARMAIYRDIYGARRCKGGFVAMRFNWPRPSATVSTVKIDGRNCVKRVGKAVAGVSGEKKTRGCKRGCARSQVRTALMSSL